MSDSECNKYEGQSAVSIVLLKQFRISLFPLDFLDSVTQSVKDEYMMKDIADTFQHSNVKDKYIYLIMFGHRKSLFRGDKNHIIQMSVSCLYNLSFAD